MEIIIAKTAGFCFGVNKAVNLLFELVKSTSQKIYTLGPIIHNDQVVEYLEKKGVRVIKDISEADREGHVVIRTHGVASCIYDRLNSEGLQFTDATCPYVKKIHNLVKEKYSEGYRIIIIGDKEHPEVKGINGWCNNSAIIISNEDETDKLAESDEKYCIVAQTTLMLDKWNNITTRLEKKLSNIGKYNTICNATSMRQTEAVEIAKDVDIMIVIGGKNSSNTQKLYDICKTYCTNTLKIETSGDLPPMNIKKFNKIGVTAGASTPDWIIKEVVLKMDELYRQENELNLEEAYESALKTLHTGQIVKGTIVGFNNNEVFVDIGYKSDGVIPMDQFMYATDAKPSEVVKVGSEVEATVIRVNDGEGIVVLSKKRVDSRRNWDNVEKAYESKEPVKARVTEVVNGGVIAVADGARIFIPASQIGGRFEKDLSKYIKQDVDIRIIEFNKQKRKLVGSQRILLMEQKEAKMNELWSDIEVGKQYTGTVKSLTDFGAFVDIGGVDGLIHITELSWTKIKHPSEVLKIGDKVDVTILEFDREKGRIALGYRKPADNPWSNIGEKYKVGETTKGIVVRLAPFGAFIELEKGVDGLVHISQITNSRLAKPGDVLTVGEEVEVKIMDVNTETQKIGLSIKEVKPLDDRLPNKTAPKNNSNEPVSEENIPTEHKEEMTNTIGDLLTDLDKNE